MPSIKKGASFINLSLPSATAASTIAQEYPYHAAGWTNRIAYDYAMEVAMLGSMVTQSGTFANWSVLTLKHFNGAGSVVDQISLVGSGPTANENMDITGLAASTGNTLAQNWLLQPGDSVELAGTATAAAPAVSVTLCVDVPR